MSLYTNVNRILIGDGTTTAGSVSLQTIKKGDLIILDEKGAIVDTVAKALALSRMERIRIVSAYADGQPIVSSPIQGNTVSQYAGATYQAPVEMVETIGFNGTASTGISITSGTEYRLRVRILDNHRPNGQRPTLSDVNYTAGVADTEETVAYKIACLFYQSDYGHSFMRDKVKLERVSDGTFAALTNPAAVINGSDIVVSTAHGLTGTGFIRIGGTGTGEAVYGYTVVDVNTLKLDVAYQGVTNGALAGASIGGLTTITEWGFKLTALAQNSDLNRNGNEPVDQYEWLTFVSNFTDADDLASSQYVATKTLVAGANPGKGYWKQVADAEEAAKGYLGDTSKRRFFDKRINSNVVVDAEYDQMIITHAEIMGGDFQGTYSAPLQTEIYFPNGSDQADNTPGNNKFTAITNAYFGTTLGLGLITY